MPPPKACSSRSSRHAEPIVVHLDDRVAVAQHRPDGNPAAADFARQPVLDRVLDQRLQDHARNDDVERVRR